MDTVGVFHEQLAPVVFLRLRQEQRRGEIGADTGSGALDLPDGVVDVIAEGVPTFVAIEQRREHPGGERCRNKERMALECREDHLAQLTRHGVVTTRRTTDCRRSTTWQSWPSIASRSRRDMSSNRTAPQRCRSRPGGCAPR